MFKKSNNFLSELPQTYFLHRDGALIRVIADTPDELRYLRTELEILRRIGRKSKSWQGIVESDAFGKYSETDHTELDRIMLDAGHPLIDEMLALFDEEYGEIKDEILLSIVDEEAANIVQQAADCGVLKMIEKKDGIVHMTNPYDTSLPSDIEDALAAAENALAKAASLIPDDPNEDDSTARNDGTILDTLQSMVKEVHEEDGQPDEPQNPPLEFLEEDEDKSDQEHDVVSSDDQEDGNDAQTITKTPVYQDKDLSLLNQSHPIDPYAIDPDSNELETMELDTSYVSQEEQQTNVENVFEQYSKITEKHLTSSSEQPDTFDQNEIPSDAMVEHQTSASFELPEPEAVISAAMDQQEQPAIMDPVNPLTEPEIVNEENKNSPEDQTPDDSSILIKDPDPEAIFAAAMDKLDLSPRDEPAEQNEQLESIDPESKQAIEQPIIEEPPFQIPDPQAVIDGNTTAPETSLAEIPDEDSSVPADFEINNSANDETENQPPLDPQPTPVIQNEPVSPFASMRPSHQNENPETDPVDETQPTIFDQTGQDSQTSQYDEPVPETSPNLNENEQVQPPVPVDHMEQSLVLDANDQEPDDQNNVAKESDLSEPPVLMEINEHPNESIQPDESTESVFQSNPELDCLPIVAESHIPDVASQTESTSIDPSAPQPEDQQTSANQSYEEFDIEYTPERAQQAVAEIEKGIRKIAGVLNTEVNDQWKTAQQSLQQINDTQTNVSQTEQNVETIMLEITQLKEEIQAIRDEADQARQEARQYREEARLARERAIASAEMAELAADQANKEVENARKAINQITNQP